jgi:hypothetical protein
VAPLAEDPGFMKRVLIVTLHSGEDDFPHCLKSLEGQTHRDFEHRVISGLGNLEAHAALYAMIQRESAAFGAFLKLDADMVFRTKEGLARMLREMAAIEQCDHATWPVLDFLSETKLRGVHMFSPRVTWPHPLHRVFVDPDPVIPGRRKEFPATAESHVMHAAFPSRLQAFQFGVHRGTKCFSSQVKGGGQVMRYFQFKLLAAVWEMFVRTKDGTRGMAMMGAEWARRNRGRAVEYRADGDARAHFESIREIGFQEAYDFCRPYWGARRRTERLKYWLLAQSDKFTRRG